MSLLETLTEAVSDNLRTLMVVGAGYGVAVQQGYAAVPEIPAVPEWWQLPVMVTVSAAIVGAIIGGKIPELLPDPRGHFLVELDGGDEQGGAIWELNDEAWQEMDVVDGTLFPWSGSSEDVHEVRIYNPETNTSVANWRGTKVASALLEDATPEEAMQQIRELRDEYERAAREGDYIKRNIGGILRKVDKQRAKDYDAALQDHIAPSLNDGDSYDELITQSLPDELLPDYMSVDHDQEPEPFEVDGDEMDFQVLEDGEAIDPMPDYAAATDGGEER